LINAVCIHGNMVSREGLAYNGAIKLLSLKNQ
jgi:hypothetical protein